MNKKPARRRIRRDDHDQIFKSVVREFFREFVELFLPDEALRIDFSRVEFIDKEMFGDRLKGSRRQLDMVVKVGVAGGGEEFVLVHVEFESGKPKDDFPERMFRYFCHLYIRHGLPVIPVALFTDDLEWSPEVVPDSFDISLGGAVVNHFKYTRVKLLALDYRAYLRSRNPLAYALMAKMKYDRRQIVRLKADFLRMMLKCPIDDARKSLLFEFIDHYMPLARKQQREFHELVQNEKQDDNEVYKMITSFERQGIKLGMQQGLLCDARESVLDILETRFGQVSDPMQNRISKIDDIQKLRELRRIAVTVPSLNDLSL